ncbi:hypothetical protein Tco_0230812 [Tanacetum coccineum]
MRKTEKLFQNFVPIGSAKEEELITKMNEKATDEDTSNKEKVLEEPDSTKVEVKKEGHEDKGVDLVIWGDLRIMFDANTEDELWQNQYPLTKETLKRMLSLRLVARTASEDAYTLLRFIQKQIDEYGSHDGALAIPGQTATGKESSNLLMADSL